MGVGVVMVATVGIVGTVSIDSIIPCYYSIIGVPSAWSRIDIASILCSSHPTTPHLTLSRHGTPVFLPRFEASRLVPCALSVENPARSY